MEENKDENKEKVTKNTPKLQSLLHSAYNEDDFPETPFLVFKDWYRRARLSKMPWAHNMVISTVDEELQPHVRTVSLYEWSEKGFIFCTNYASQKARHLEKNPKAAICFQWEAIDKQVRICGTVEKVSPEETERLFRSCHRDSQIVFWATSEGTEHPFNQSKVMDTSRDERIKYMDEKMKIYRYNNEPVPVPKCWGGYILKPHLMEFTNVASLYAESLV